MKRKTIITGFIAWCILLAGCGRDDEMEKFVRVSRATLDFEYDGAAQFLVISASSDWTISSSEEWCEVQPFTGKAGTDTVYVSVPENDGTVVRKANLTIIAEGLTQSVVVEQNFYNPDGTVYAYLTATKGKGVKVVVMGDGFTLEDMNPGGKYEKSMGQAVEYLLEIEPFRSYRDYFTAWVVKAVSNESGIGDYTGRIDTRFQAKYESATSTAMTCDTAMCFRYAFKAPIEDKLDETLIILVTNSVRYAGSTYMYTGGASIAICPMAQKQPYENFKGIVQHEAGGHGFAKLIDEYIYDPGTLPQMNADWIRANEKYGFYSNVDLTRDLNKIKWAHFIGRKGYEQVGAYEGAYKYGKGIWRPESISCMDDMRPYYNAPSRESIVRRICQLAGLVYSLEDFIAQDVAAGTSFLNSSARERTTPLPSPVVVHGSPVLAE